MRRPQALLPATDPWRVAAARLALFAELGASLAVVAVAVHHPALGSAALMGVAVRSLNRLRLR
jgi:hypothetical protein